jgi:hypothetical protein
MGTVVIDIEASEHSMAEIMDMLTDVLDVTETDYRIRQEGHA